MLLLLLLDLDFELFLLDEEEDFLLEEEEDFRFEDDFLLDEKEDFLLDDEGEDFLFEEDEYFLLEDDDFLLEEEVFFFCFEVDFFLDEFEDVFVGTNLELLLEEATAEVLLLDGSLHSLSLTLSPPPQVREHEDHGLQSLQEGHSFSLQDLEKQIRFYCYIVYKGNVFFPTSPPLAPPRI